MSKDLRHTVQASGLRIQSLGLRVLLSSAFWPCPVDVFRLLSGSRWRILARWDQNVLCGRLLNPNIIQKSNIGI